MGSIGRYVFRTTMGAFLVVLVTLTTLIWMSQALRDVDLMTNQGQSALVFVGITSLVIPLLVVLLAPLALVVAMAYVLNKLSNDSELIVMNAAGMSPMRLFRCFLPAIGIVALLVAFTTAYLAPKGLRESRAWLTQVRADLLSFVAQPGRFISLERGLTFHVRERQTNGMLLGILVDDQRDPAERSTILAHHGSIIKNDDGTFLVLEDGTVQRQRPGERDAAIVAFDRYAFDLSRFSAVGAINYPPRERYLTELLWPDQNDPSYKERAPAFRNELLDRFAAPFYPVAFAIVVYAFLGAPRTTRQTREFAVLGLIGSIALIRLIGVTCSVLGTRTPALQMGQFAVLAIATALGLMMIRRAQVVETPAFVSNAIASVLARFTRPAMAS